MFKPFALVVAALLIAALLAGCATPQLEPVAVRYTQIETSLTPTGTSRPTSTATATPTISSLIVLNACQEKVLLFCFSLDDYHREKNP